MLLDQGVINQRVHTWFDAVCDTGNKAVHDGFAAQRDALKLVRTCYELGAWFHRTVTQSPHGHIRQVVEHLKSRGYNRPLSELTFATVSNRVYSQHDDGTWEGDLRPDQLVLREVLDLEPLRQRIAEGTRRDQALVGKVERRRGALGNKPLLAGTRVPVETIQRYLAAGRSTDDVLEAFPMLTVSDVEAVRRETVA